MLTLTTIWLFLRQCVAKLLRRPACERHFDYVLSFGSPIVRGCETLVANSKPDVAFRPERLVIPSDVARRFLVESLKIDGVEQLASGGATPAVVFGDQSYGPRMKMDVAHPTSLVTITVVNHCYVGHVFQCALIGPRI